MKTKSIRRLLSVICFLLLFLLLYFLGSSHAYYGIYPMDFWSDYGVASYVFGCRTPEPAIIC